MRGYTAEVKALGLGEPRLIRLGESPITMSHGGPAMAALLEAWPDTDAVMCVSDMSAFGAIMECQRRGLSVPRDLAVAGFGNFEVSWCNHPTITTISVDAYGIGQRAGEALLAALDASLRGERKLSGDGRATRVKIDYTVVPRESA
jgi:LacI family gluconate utilization system Gnt-I transcriptional repressor